MINGLFRSLYSQNDLPAGKPQLYGCLLTVLVIALGVTGCDWVDSTGRQNNSNPETAILLDDAVIGGIAPVLQEESSAQITATGSDADGFVQSWRWSQLPVAEGNLDACRDADGFPQALAADSLLQACTSPDICSVDFEEQATDQQGGTEFILTVPRLRAPVGVTYELFATDNEGGSARNEYTFCLISINEAPEAVADVFTVLEGNTLVITAGIDEIDLLSNDIDDEDITNRPLQVNTQAVHRPAAASVFELQNDGGFTYRYAGNNLATDLRDEFEYEISDGMHTATASVTLRIVARDDEPDFVGPIPAFTAVAGIAFEESISDYFIDPEGAALIFEVVDGDLPPSGELSLDSFGTLAGTADADDVADYEFDVSASDGVQAATGSVSLSVIDNAPVEVDPIPDQTTEVGAVIRFSVVAYFTDPEDQVLNFTLNSSDSEVQLTIDARTGLVRGFFTDEGGYSVEIAADDGFNFPTVIEVDIIVEPED